MTSREARRRRPPSRFERWAWSPIVILRVALVSTYLLYIYAGVIAVIAGVPVFSLTAPEGYATVWGVLMCTAALVCAIGGVTERWQVWERWASLALSALMLAYVGGLNGVAFLAGDINRMFIGGIAAIALVLPVCRFVYLASQAGRRHPIKHE